MKMIRKGDLFCLLDNENVVEQSSRQSALHFEVVYTNIHDYIRVCGEYPKGRVIRALTWPKMRRLHMPCFLLWCDYFPSLNLFIHFPLCHCFPYPHLSLSLTLSLSFSPPLWLSMLIPIAIYFYHYLESRNWLYLTYCYNTRQSTKKHILVIHFGFEQKMCNR